MFCSGLVKKSLNFNKLSYKNFAVNEKALKMRIKSVSSIEKITKAMKMVSASKMKNDLDRMSKGKDFGHGAIDKIFKSDVYMQKKTQGLESGNKALYVPITSDKGLCGGTNSGIIREVKNMLNASPHKNDCGIFVIGDKGVSGLSRPFPDLLKAGCNELVVPINYLTSASIAGQINVLSKSYDKIVICYNHYVSAISTEVRKIELMPQSRFNSHLKIGKLYWQRFPDKNTSIPCLFDLYLSSNLYSSMLNNLASEQSARMNAMENASKNAKEIVGKLNIQYNKARQARITMELVEIISGASAV